MLFTVRCYRSMSMCRWLEMLVIILMGLGDESVIARPRPKAR